MSIHIPAAPKMSLNVKYTRKIQANRREEENQLEIFKDEECGANPGSQKASAHTQTCSAAGRRCLKAAAAALAVMYLLTLAAILIRYIFSTLEKDQLQRKYENLHNDHSQLQNKLKQLQDKVAGMCCPEGWKRFGCSCYYKSSERKNWDESRTECRNRESDLVVINSEEEQEFVRDLNEPGASWIGLKAEFTHKSAGWEPKWEWVDGSPLTVEFWETGHSKKTWYQYAECCSPRGKWTQKRHYESNKWICEKKIICFPCFPLCLSKEFFM